MKQAVCKTLLVSAFVGGLWVTGAGVASAAETTGEEGILSGNQAVVDVQLPVTLSGNALGGSDATSNGADTKVASAEKAAVNLNTEGLDSVLSGNQAIVSVSAPVTAAGNAASVTGDAVSEGSATSTAASKGSSTSAAPAATTSGNDSAVSGNQAPVSVAAPVTVAGNSVSVLGDATSSNADTKVQPSSGEATSTKDTTSGDEGVAAGNQLPVAVAAPVTLAGNSLSILGDATSSEAQTSVSNSSGAAEDDAAVTGTTSGEESVASGNQVPVNVAAPITAAGNSVSVLGDSWTENAQTSVVNSSETSTQSSDSATTSGDEGVAAGNQVPVDGAVPVTLGGNALSLLGDAGTEGATTEVTTNRGTTAGSMTGGDDSLLSGNQLPLNLAAPLTVAGNGISVVGDAWTENSSTTVDSATGSTSNWWTSGEEGLLSGNLLPLDVLAPVTIGGNAISVVDDAISENATTEVITRGSEGGENVTSGNEGVISGNQLPLGVALPVTIGGNAISVLDDATTTGSTTTVDATPGVTDTVTSGDEGLLSGNLLPVNLFTPVTAGGNAISVIGEATVTNPTTTVEEGTSSEVVTPGVPTVPTVPGDGEGVVPAVPAAPGAPGSSNGGDQTPGDVTGDNSGDQVTGNLPGASGAPGMFGTTATIQTGVPKAQEDTSRLNDRLAMTGVELPVALAGGLAALLVLMGAGLLFLSRRRQWLMS